MLMQNVAKHLSENLILYHVSLCQNIDIQHIEGSANKLHTNVFAVIVLVVVFCETGV